MLRHQAPVCMERRGVRHDQQVRVRCRPLGFVNGHGRCRCCVQSHNRRVRFQGLCWSVYLHSGGYVMGACGSKAMETYPSLLYQRCHACLALASASRRAVVTPPCVSAACCRERCGGQGYLSVNRFGELIGFAHAGMTAEGDNRWVARLLATLMLQ